MPISGVVWAQRSREKRKCALLKCSADTGGPHWSPPPPLYVASTVSNLVLFAQLPIPHFVPSALAEGPVVSEMFCFFFLKWFSGSPTEGLPEHSLSFLSPSAFSALKACYNTFPILLLPINSAPWHHLRSRPLTSWTCYCPFFCHRPPMEGREFGYCKGLHQVFLWFVPTFRHRVGSYNASSFSQLLVPRPHHDWRHYWTTSYLQFQPSKMS